MMLRRAAKYPHQIGEKAYAGELIPLLQDCERSPVRAVERKPGCCLFRCCHYASNEKSLVAPRVHDRTTQHNNVIQSPESHEALLSSLVFLSRRCNAMPNTTTLCPICPSRLRLGNEICDRLQRTERGIHLSLEIERKPGIHLPSHSLQILLQIVR